jgi:hypothetical protein
MIPGVSTFGEATMDAGLSCQTCASPLDEEGACVTCAARQEGLRLVSRAPYAQARELQVLLEAQGIAAELEQLPAGPQAEGQPKAQAPWNLYAPEADLDAARAFLKKDWASLLQDPEAEAAAARGDEPVDLDAGGEITCPACGHRFTITAALADCPECGLSLGVADAGGDAEADEGRGEGRGEPA